MVFDILSSVVFWKEMQNKTIQNNIHKSKTSWLAYFFLYMNFKTQVNINNK